MEYVGRAVSLLDFDDHVMFDIISFSSFFFNLSFVLFLLNL